MKKLEIRKPKLETNPKLEFRTLKRPISDAAILFFRNSGFEFVSSFDISIFSLRAFDSDSDVRAAGELDLAIGMIAIKIIGNSLQREDSGDRGYGHIPRIEDFDFEFHAVLENASTTEWFGKFEFPGGRL